MSFHAMDLLESHLLYFARHVGFASNNNILHMGMIHYYILTSFVFQMQGGTHWTQWGLVLGEVLKSIDGI